MAKELYNKRSIKDITKMLNKSTTAFINPFGENTVGAVLYARAERLATATYLVTNAIPYKEEIRNTIRRQARHLIALVLELRSGVHTVGTQSVTDLVVCVKHCVSLIDLLYVSGLISEMNAEVLKGAYTDFGMYIQNAMIDNRADAVAIAQDFFAQVPEQQIEKDASQGHKGQSKKSIKDIKDTIKDTESIKDIKDTQQKNSVRKQPLNERKRLAHRRMQVIDVITQKGRASSKEIQIALPNLSAKMISRELHSLVEDGVIEREGEKRWAVYSLSLA